jgi:hypothetical protein
MLKFYTLFLFFKKTLNKLDYFYTHTLLGK